MRMVKIFEFFAIVAEILSSKHQEIQEFAKNYHISAMKFNKMFFFNISTSLLHYDIIIDELSDITSKLIL
jgi:hypothetical protein